jgi:hypothetical protein
MKGFFPTHNSSVVECNAVASKCQNCTYQGNTLEPVDAEMWFLHTTEYKINFFWTIAFEIV